MERVEINIILKYSIVALSIFLIAFFLGYANSVVGVQLNTDKVTGQVMIKQVHAFQTYQKFQTTEVDPTANQGPFIRAIVFIILNAIVGLSIMLTGPILVRFFGIWFGSSLILANNGYAIGEMCFIIARSFGLKSTMLSILLHGLFELSAFFLCAGVGLLMGYNIMIERCKEPKFHNYNETVLALYNDMKECIKFYCKIILPMFIIAGFIEIFVSPIIISWLIASKGVI